jgi:hypothetical protein
MSRRTLPTILEGYGREEVVEALEHLRVVTSLPQRRRRDRATPATAERELEALDIDDGVAGHAR